MNYSRKEVAARIRSAKSPEELGDVIAGLMSYIEKLEIKISSPVSAEGLRESINAALHELGEPGPGYPAPVANAVDILLAALRGTGPSPDSDAVLLANAILGGSSYLPHREAAERILARDTGPRPDSEVCIFDWRPEGASFGPCPACGSEEPHIRLSTPRTDD